MHNCAQSPPQLIPHDRPAINPFANGVGVTVARQRVGPGGDTEQGMARPPALAQHRDYIAAATQARRASWQLSMHAILR